LGNKSKQTYSVKEIISHVDDIYKGVSPVLDHNIIIIRVAIDYKTDK